MLAREVTHFTCSECGRPIVGKRCNHVCSGRASPPGACTPVSFQAPASPSQQSFFLELLAKVRAKVPHERGEFQAKHVRKAMGVGGSDRATCQYIGQALDRLSALGEITPVPGHNPKRYRVRK